MLVLSEIQRLRDVKRFIRQPYAWPGGYPQALITSDGAALCYQCSCDNWQHIARESFDNSQCGWRASGVGVNWENTDLSCDHCGEKIPAAYEES